MSVHVLMHQSVTLNLPSLFVSVAKYTW